MFGISANLRHACAATIPGRVEFFQYAWKKSGLWNLVFAVGIVLAPVSEELLFRGIGLPLLIRRIGVWPAVCLLSLFFAALHLHIPSLIPLFLIGAAFSLAYLYTGAIAVPIAMHVIFNAVNIGLMFLLR